jgi:hypothetical protein
VTCSMQLNTGEGEIKNEITFKAFFLQITYQSSEEICQIRCLSSCGSISSQLGLKVGGGPLEASHQR